MIENDKPRHAILSTAEKVGSIITEDKELPKEKFIKTYERLRERLKHKPSIKKPKSQNVIKITEYHEKRAIQMLIGGFFIFLVGLLMISILLNWIPLAVIVLMIQFGYTGALIALIILICAVVALLVLYFATRTQDTEKEEIEF